jgi:hypothetical protein
MARNKYSFKKRNRELAQKQKNQEKLSRKQEARERKEETDTSVDGYVDSDIAGIVPGPQPLPEQWSDVDNREKPPVEETKDETPE